MKLLTILITLAMATVAQAGDSSSFKSLGFSSDGHYYAFIQDGELNGLGAYYMELGIIDVHKNIYVGKAKHIAVDEEETPVEYPDLDKILKGLKKELEFEKFGFSKPIEENILVSRPDNDLTPYTKTLFTLDYWPQGGAHSPFETYELLLKEVPAPITENNNWCDYYSNNMIELRLKWQHPYEENEYKIKDLQIDKKQPKVRYCSGDYSIREVRSHKGHVAVAIRFTQPGFEGPDQRFMVVTGKL